MASSDHDPPGGRQHESVRTLPLGEGARLHQELRNAMKAPHRPVLVVLTGNDMGVRKPLEGTLLVGRDPHAGLVLSDAGVSWHHLRVEDRGDSWTAVDLGSTNGTVVNGSKARETVLRSGDRIVLGRTVLRFEVHDALEQAYDDQVRKMLEIDDLSGLFVRRKFDLEVQRLLDAAQLRGTPLGLLAMDLDGIKGINDAHGHLFGAYVIGTAGHVLGRTLAGRGPASRFGGDEFVAALPGLDRAASELVGLELLRAINEEPFEHEGVRLRPGISIGVAAFPADASSAATLFQRADEALYRAKRAGKNRVSP